MKYPTRIIIEFSKKYKKTQYDHWISFCKEYLNKKVFINFKGHDSRAGIRYKIYDILEYDSDIEMKLLRVDHKKI